MRIPSSSWLLASLVLAGCGGIVTSNQSAGSASGAGGATSSSSTHASGTGGSASSASTAASSGAGGSAPAGCPSQPPTAGTSCNLPATVDGSPSCTFGTEQIPECRQAFSCVNGQWQDQAGAFGPCPSPAKCPASQPADSADCTGAPSECGYPDGTLCSCGTFIGQVWACYTPSAPCPSLAPNAGTACAMEGLNCPYESCNLFVRCSGGIWTWQHVAC